MIDDCRLSITAGEARREKRRSPKIRKSAIQKSTIYNLKIYNPQIANLTTPPLEKRVVRPYKCSIIKALTDRPNDECLLLFSDVRQSRSIVRALLMTESFFLVYFLGCVCEQPSFLLPCL